MIVLFKVIETFKICSCQSRFFYIQARVISSSLCPDYLGGVYIASVCLKSPLPSWTQPDLSTNEAASPSCTAEHVNLVGVYTPLQSRGRRQRVGLYEGISLGDAFTFRVSAGRGLVLDGMGLSPATVGLCVRCVKNRSGFFPL